MAAVRKWMGRDGFGGIKGIVLHTAITIFAELFRETRRLGDDRVEDVQRARCGPCRGPYLARAIGCHVDERAMFAAPGNPTQGQSKEAGGIW